MCAIVGALLWDITTNSKLNEVNDLLSFIISQSHERGRDGFGIIVNDKEEFEPTELHDIVRCDGLRTSGQMNHIHKTKFAVLLANLRAEPTTEYVVNKSLVDQQPYTCGGWSIVHNGTIANDKELRTHNLKTQIDSAAIAEQLAKNHDRFSIDGLFTTFTKVVDSLKGSYAILANYRGNKNCIFAAANYRPIWWIETEFGVFFASSRDYFPDAYVPQMLRPYTVAVFENLGHGLRIHRMDSYKEEIRCKALVVCSGGLDSVVAATYAQRELGYDIELIHFQYGSRAEGPEVKAVQAVARELGVKCTLFPLPVYKKSDSPLLDPDSAVAGGEEGAEFAHEWVPARNLLLLSVATAFAEANGFDMIVLGNNLEEAGAYPDNEPEFIAKFNDLLPFAVGDGKRMEVIMPVGNLMKHEIVALGNRLNAPTHLTWSCYRAGDVHCGKCGPCFMRRTAFAINKIPETIEYKE